MKSFVKNRTRPFWLVLGFLLIAVIGSIDAQFSSEVVTAPFYFIPIAILAWFIGRDHAMAGAVVSTIMWSAADLYTQVHYSSPTIFYWNNLVILLLFTSSGIFLSELRVRQSRIDQLYVTDTLTGAVNIEIFQQLIQMEMDRNRHLSNPFTIVYIDVDGLQKINDDFGYSTGDKVLRTIAETLRKSLRKTDSVARFGGDEFSLLLPESNKEVAREVVYRIRSTLTNKMMNNDWPLTFSIGILTCRHNPTSVAAAIRYASDAMYLVKQNGKDGLCFTTFPTS